MAWRVTIRLGPRVRRVRAADLGEAVELLERELRTADVRRDDVRGLSRTYTAQQQVAARGEVRGPGAPWSRPTGGVDVRGDGSMEAYTGRANRRLLDPADGEDVFAALLRALS